MRQKAQLADETQPGIPCASADTVLRVWEHHAMLAPNWQLARGPSLLDAWPTLAVGLLRDLAGLSWAEIQCRTGASDAAIQRRYQTPRVSMELESAYSNQAALLARSACERRPAETVRSRYCGTGTGEPRRETRRVGPGKGTSRFHIISSFMQHETTI
jgi:hypothetical protein